MIASGSNYASGVSYTYTSATLAAGGHHARFQFDDGSGPATFDSDSPTVTPVTLTGSGVSPSSGGTSTTFTFATTYTDAAGAAPTQAVLYVDGIAHPMRYVSGSYGSGAGYQASLTLPAGSHQFAFVFADASSSWADPLAPAVYAGPSVSAAAPAGAQVQAPSGPPVVIAPSHDDDPDYPLPPDTDGDG
jgi:hypothetical protein